MGLTKTERIIFSVLSITIVVGLMLLIVRIGNQSSTNAEILLNINAISKLTDKRKIEKTFYFNESENFNKLNLNRTDLVNIKRIPCLTAPLAKRIFEFIKEKGKISDMKELLDVKGMNKKKLKQLDKYATVLGGHTGSAYWGSKVDLNFTTIDELKARAGISKKVAEKIIEYRNTKGGFHSVDDLYVIPGLGMKSIESFIDKVEVK